MTKPNTLKIIQLIAALFCISKLALDIFIVLYDHPSVNAALFGEDINKDVLPISIKLGLIAEAVFISLPIGITAALNYTKTELDRRRGKKTLLFAGLMFMVNYLASILADRIVKALINQRYGEKTLALFSRINSVRSFSGFLIIAAFVMVCCCAAVEVYGGAKVSSKPA